MMVLILGSGVVFAAAYCGQSQSQNCVDRGQPALLDVPFNSFCWRETKSRGLGSKRPKAATPCPSGYDLGAMGVFCRQECPEGFKILGDLCKPTSEVKEDMGVKTISRGRGFASQQKCESKRTNKCEKEVALWYPLCGEGYIGKGMRCVPLKDTNCASFGLKNGPGKSCVREKVKANRWLPCPEGTYEGTNNKCYATPCPSGFEGNSICWGPKPSPEWVRCGGAAFTENKGYCAKKIVSTVISFVDLMAGLPSNRNGKKGSKKSSKTENAMDDLDSPKVNVRKSAIKRLNRDLVRMNKRLSRLEKKKAKFYREGDNANGNKLSIRIDEITVKIKNLEGRLGFIENLVENGLAVPDTSKQEYWNAVFSTAAMLEPIGIVGLALEFSHPKCNAIR
ncbi:MAG: hypothetical protein ACON5C_10915 [Alphaproteobacteria bacterium]